MPDLRRPAFGGIILGFAGFWLALILLFAAQTSMIVGQDWRDALRGALGLWLPWIIVSPCMLAMAIVFPVGQRRWWRWVPLHIVACIAIVFSGGWLARNVFGPPPGPLEAAGGPPPGPGQPFPPPPGRPLRPGQVPTENLMRGLPVGIPLYVTALLLVGMTNILRTAQEKELRATELERQLAAARLETLQSQLQPHFLFNTLNTLVSLVATDSGQAEAVILHLSRLLRATLEAREKPLISLQKEMALAHDYLEIQRIRFGDKLAVEELADPAARSCAIPPLILQPLLENSVKYALERNPVGARIRLKTQRSAERLVIEVEDSGGGPASAIHTGHGVGLENVRRRLEASFASQPVVFELRPNTLGGITVHIELPAVAPR